MTSRTGQTRPRPKATIWTDVPGRGKPRPPEYRARFVSAGAFTLLEVVLALALVLLLAGAVMVSFQGVFRDTQMRESTTRLTTLLLAARAEAANAGRRLRLTFDSTSGQPALEVESDPLGAPGVFQPFGSTWVELARLENGIYVARCELTDAGPQPADTEPQSATLADGNAAAGTGASAGTGAGAGGTAQDPALAAVMFYPDGTSDSVRIVVYNDDADSPSAVELSLNGLDGTVRQRELDLKEEPIAGS